MNSQRKLCFTQEDFTSSPLLQGQRHLQMPIQVWQLVVDCSRGVFLVCLVALFRLEAYFRGPVRLISRFVLRHLQDLGLRFSLPVLHHLLNPASLFLCFAIRYLQILWICSTPLRNINFHTLHMFSNHILPDHRCHSTCLTSLPFHAAVGRLPARRPARSNGRCPPDAQLCHWLSEDCPPAAT